MTLAVLTLVLLACISYRCRVHTTKGQLAGSSCDGQQCFLSLLDELPNVDHRLELRALRSVGHTGACNKLKAIANLLHVFVTPKAGWQMIRSGRSLAKYDLGCRRRRWLSAILMGQGTSSTSKLASWRDRIDYCMELSRKKRNPPYIQLATIDFSGPVPAPACRTVVFRGFLADQPDVLKIITDARSEKVAHLEKNPQVEVNWWFPASKEQFRIAGRAELHSFGGRVIGEGPAKKEAVLQQWQQMRDAAREQFFWEQPGETFSGAEYSKGRKYDFGDTGDGTPVGNLETSGTGDSKIPPGGRDSDGEILDPPETFLLLLIYPQQVKYLRLGDNFATIDRLADGSWTTERVNP